MDMPLDYVRPQIQSYEGASIVSAVDSQTAAGLRAIAKETGVTEYMILLAGLMVTLSKYSRQEDIIVGSPVSGRTHKDTESMLGMFVNTLAMRGYPEGQKTFAEFLNEIRETCLNAYENQEYPLEELVEAVAVRRDMSRSPLFDVLFTMQNNEIANVDVSNVTIDDTKSMENQTEHSVKFDLLYTVISMGDIYVVSLRYCTALFREETARRILNGYNEALKCIAADYNRRISDISMLTEDERNQVVNSFNNTDKDYRIERTIAEMFEEQAARTPERIAIIFEDKYLNYSNLNSKINSLANKLRIMGIGSNDFVAIIADRSIEMVCGVYAVLKAGAAYVPIDPTYPEERINYMLGDCKPKLVLKYTAEQIELPKDVPFIDLGLSGVWKGFEENPKRINKPSDIAYCIYTSGTSGEPKGVVLEHRSVMNHLNVMRNKFYFSSDPCATPLFTSFAFDFVVPALFGTLLFGDRLVIMKDIYALADFSEECRLAVLKITPSYFNSIHGSFNKHRGQIKTVVFGGESLTPETINNVYKAFGGDVRIFNEYGPTEATVFTSVTEVHAGEPVTIGKPVENSHIYIMNGDELCGIGVPGELCITGVGVARHYLNRPELTAEKFVKNPFGSGTMYRSGDLARWTSNGNIEYLGRIDDQVKIRGYRVELGEIDSRIRDIENVKDCAVIARADSTGEKSVYAYYTSDCELSPAEINDKLRTVLPNYMIPTYMMQIDTIPVTQNGKLDKRALPEIKAAGISEYVPAETPTQKLLCDLFGEVLGVERVGIKDNFFDLGGSSLRALQILSRMRELDVKCRYHTIYTAKSIEELAYKIDNNDFGDMNIRRRIDEGEKDHNVLSALFEQYDKSFADCGEIFRYKPLSLCYEFFYDKNNVTITSQTVQASSDEMVIDAVVKLIKEQDVLHSYYSYERNEIVVCEQREINIPVYHGNVNEQELRNVMRERLNQSADVIIPSFILIEKRDVDKYNVICLLMHALSDEFSKQLFKERLRDILYSDQPMVNKYRYSEYAEKMARNYYPAAKELYGSEFFRTYSHMVNAQKAMLSETLRISDAVITKYAISKKLTPNEAAYYYEKPLEAASVIILDMLRKQFGREDLNQIACVNLTNCRNEENRYALGFFLDYHPFIYSNGKVTEYDGLILKPKNLDYKVMCCGSTGTNAVEAALKLARKNKKRNNIFAFSGAFHGMTLGSLACTTDKVSREGAGIALNNVAFMPYCNSKIDSIDYIEEVISDDHSGIDKPAGIILETVQAEGGINVADAEWLRSIRKICDKYDIMMIVDDIQVGNGRTGEFFSFERAGIVPDMVILSKSISGFGVPMSLLLIKPEYDIFRPAEHNGTFRGNQLAFVGGKAALEYFTKHNLPSEVKRKGAFIENFIKTEICPLDERLSYRGIGMIWGINFSEIDSKLALECVHSAFDNGVILEVAGRGDSVLKILSPLTIEDSVLSEGLYILKNVIKKVLSAV